MLTAGIHKAYEAGVQALSEHNQVETVARGRVGQGIAQGIGRTVRHARGYSFIADGRLGHEVFGASSLLVRRPPDEDTHGCSFGTAGGSIDGDAADGGWRTREPRCRLIPMPGNGKAGRILAYGWPNGVSRWSHAMVHGGPFRGSCLGAAAPPRLAHWRFQRFLRPCVLPEPIARSLARRTSR